MRRQNQPILKSNLPSRVKTFAVRIYCIKLCCFYKQRGLLKTDKAASTWVQKPVTQGKRCHCYETHTYYILLSMLAFHPRALKKNTSARSQTVHANPFAAPTREIN